MSISEDTVPKHGLLHINVYVTYVMFSFHHFQLQKSVFFTIINRLSNKRDLFKRETEAVVGMRDRTERKTTCCAMAILVRLVVSLIADHRLGFCCFLPEKVTAQPSVCKLTKHVLVFLFGRPQRRSAVFIFTISLSRH